MPEDTRWMRQCSRWLECACNVCPLDPLRNLRRIDREDPDTSCNAPIRERLEIVALAKSAGVELDPMNDRESKSGRSLEDVMQAGDARTVQRREHGLKMKDRLIAARLERAEQQRAAKEPPQ